MVGVPLAGVAWVPRGAPVVFVFGVGLGAGGVLVWEVVEDVTVEEAEEDEEDVVEVLSSLLSLSSPQVLVGTAVVGNEDEGVGLGVVCAHMAPGVGWACVCMCRGVVLGLLQFAGVHVVHWRATLVSGRVGVIVGGGRWSQRTRVGSQGWTRQSRGGSVGRGCFRARGGA